MTRVKQTEHPSPASSTVWEILFGFYGFLWLVIQPLLWCSKRMRKNFRERLVPKTYTTAVDFWLQAASGGEAYLVQAVLPELIKEYSEYLEQGTEWGILLTTYTQQGRDVLEHVQKQMKLIAPHVTIQVRYLPLDRPRLVRKALKMAQPKVLILFETELWPALLYEARKQNIVVGMVNARMSEKSFTRYKALQSFFQQCSIAAISAISEADARRFQALFPHTSVQVMDNIKFDRAYWQMESIAGQTMQAHALLAEEQCVVTLASVREEEEALLLPLLQRLYTTPKCRIVIAPRHMHRVSAWQGHLEKNNIPYLLRSKQSDTAGIIAEGVLLWDAFGELNALYASSQVVFVGGSLAPLGGQNFLEPIAFGISPFVGPYLKNFAWVDESLEQWKLVHIRQNVEELTESMVREIDRVKSFKDFLPSQKKEIQQRFISWLADKQGGSIAAAHVIAALALGAEIPTVNSNVSMEDGKKD